MALFRSDTPLALKIKLFTEFPAVNVAEPAVFKILKLISGDVLFIVFVVAPAPVVSTSSVPDNVRLVMVDVFQTVVAKVEEQTTLPVPKLSVRTFELLEANVEVV